MSFHFLKLPDISNGWSDIPSKKRGKEKGKREEGGKKKGRIERKKRREKKKGEINKTIGKKERWKWGFNPQLWHELFSPKHIPILPFQPLICVRPSKYLN